MRFTKKESGEIADEVLRLRAALQAFVDAYEGQDADNFNDDLRMAYALADATLHPHQVAQ